MDLKVPPLPKAEFLRSWALVPLCIWASRWEDIDKSSRHRTQGSPPTSLGIYFQPAPHRFMPLPGPLDTEVHPEAQAPFGFTSQSLGRRN